MRLPPEIQFYEDAHLLVYRPHGLLNEASVNKVTSLIEDLEEKLKEPFDRFFDTLERDDVELNFRYVINVSLYRRLSYAGHPPMQLILTSNTSFGFLFISNFRYRPCSHSLRHPACGSNSRFSDQSPCVRGSSKSRAMAQCAARTADCGNIRRYEISRNQELMRLNFQFPLRGITPASGFNCSSTTKKTNLTI